jgi:hypothetical protein
VPQPSPGTPGTSIPPTDAKIEGVRNGIPTREVAIKAAVRRDQALSAYRLGQPFAQPLAWPVAEQTMLVTPANGRTVLDIDGVPYPPGTTEVSVADVYAHRRLRDGALVRVSS